MPNSLRHLDTATHTALIINNPALHGVLGEVIGGIEVEENNIGPGQSQMRGGTKKVGSDEGFLHLTPTFQGQLIS